MATANDVLKVAESYNGAKEGGSKHSEILNIYNSHKPLARGYTVKKTDAWCMTFISACFIKANAVEALGLTECGCQEYVNYARKNNMIVNNPTIGDLTFYDWGNDGVVDHVGIIYFESGNNLFIREGNKNDMVTTRVISKTSPSIKYFVRPRYNKQSTTYDDSKVSFAESFNKMQQVEALCNELPGLDCGSCGAPTCKALAEDIVRGLASERDCTFILSSILTAFWSFRALQAKLITLNFCTTEAKFFTQSPPLTTSARLIHKRAA